MKKDGKNNFKRSVVTVGYIIAHMICISSFIKPGDLNTISNLCLQLTKHASANNEAQRAAANNNNNIILIITIIDKNSDIVNICKQTIRVMCVLLPETRHTKEAMTMSTAVVVENVGQYDRDHVLTTQNI